jgi:Uri superfamily endonuclease
MKLPHLFSGTDAETLPPKGLTGTYLLFFDLPEAMEVTAGRLGAVQLPAGMLVYAGSALGPGGLHARLRRHLAAEKRPHWHIDALSTRIPPTYWLALADGRHHECEWAQRLAAYPAATIPVPGFGSSDCKLGCRAHLVGFPRDVTVAEIVAWVLGAER